MSSQEDHSTIKGNYKTDLTLTGLLMEGLGYDPSCLANGSTELLYFLQNFVVNASLQMHESISIFCLLQHGHHFSP